MVIEEHARMEITFPDGRFFEIPEYDIIQNSLSVTSQCVNGSTFGFGCVSPAQLSVKIHIKDLNVGRYDVYGAEIVLYSWFDKNPPDDGGKRGVFTVTSVTKSNDIFAISASDNICWLDGSAFEDSGDGMGNSIYERLGAGGSLWNAMEALGVIVGEFSEGITFHIGDLKQIEIPNAMANFSGYDSPENGEECHEIRLILLQSDEQSDNIRDYVSWLAEYMGGFAIADKNGNIQFCLFETAYDTTPEILDFSEFEQNTLEIAGFRIYLHSAKVLTEDKTWRSCDSGKIMENGVINIETIIQNNPFIEFIYSYHLPLNDCDLYPIVSTLQHYQKHIQIRPFSGTYHGKKYLHLGQYVQIMDKDGKSYDTTITNITWKFRGGQQIKCIGEDSRTLSQARKRTQAVRMGERMKTQITRLEKKIPKMNSMAQEDFDNLENIAEDTLYIIA